jgi:hypothetical protein
MMSATAGSGTAALPLSNPVALANAAGRTRSGCAVMPATTRAVPSARADLLAYATPGPPALGSPTFRSVA